MVNMKFKDMKVGNNYEVTALVIGMNELKDKNDSPFVQVILSDGESIIPALKFKTRIVDLELAGIVEGSVVKAMVAVKTYNEETSYTVTTIKLASGEYAVEDFVVKAPTSTKNDFTILMSIVKTSHTESVFDFDHAPISDLTIKLLRNNSEEFCFASAGQYMHHSEPGGLLEHTLSIVRAAELMCNNHPELDRELLICGAALHDIGKIKEMSTDMFGRTEYEPYGRLIGHSAIGINMVELEAENGDYDAERVQLLQHMIASHHGSIHSGAIVAPAVPEAVVLHALDMADGAVYKFNEVYKTLPEGCLSEKKIPQLNNQYVYRAHPAYDETTVEMFTDWNEVW